MQILDSQVAREIVKLSAAGMKQVTIKQYNADILPMGFKLDRSMDCRSMAKDMQTGERCPWVTSCARQISTGKGFANIGCDRNESGWRDFMEYRRDHFAVVRGAIFTV